MNVPWHRHLPAGTDPASIDLRARQSLPAAWSAIWREDPERPLLHGTGGWLRAAGLDERTATTAGRLSSAGVGPGDRVLISARTSIELVVAHVACLRLGAVVVPANTAYRAPELAHLVTDAEPSVAVVDDIERARWVTEVDSDVIVVDPSIPLDDADPPSLDQVGPDDPALIGYTSGTTGAPKGAALTHGNLLASSEALRLAWRWTAEDRLVLCLPLFHMHGLGVGLHGTLLTGGSAVLLDGFDVDAVLDAASEYDATMFFGVPTMYTRFADSPRVGELSRFRLCVSGSAPLSADLHRRIESASGQRVLERYGMTETMMLVSNPYDGERRAGTVGFPLPGVEVRLAEGTGEILVRGPNVFGGYRNRPEANTEAFDGGWFHTGDLGEIAEDGYLTINGRAKELVISGGYNVYPREVEDVLRQHPAVRDAAVTGTPSEEWGEVVTAHLELADPVDTDEIIAFTDERLARYKRPRLVHVVEELPRNALGKVQKHLL